MASNNAAPSSEHVTLVAPILQKLIDGVVLETLDQATGDDVFDDSPYERVLCAAWDVCTVADYAHAIESTSDFHRVFLKVKSQYITVCGWDGISKKEGMIDHYHDQETKNA